ncbi:MAG: hypothetical protein ABI640_10535 [Gammaproteobacteria bacterium]
MAAVRFSALANSTVIVAAVVYAIFLRLASGASLAGLLLGIMVMLSLLRYGYAVLRHVASGWENFPPPDIESFMLVGGLGAILHPALFGTSLYFLTTTPLVEGPLRWALLVVVLATFPASAAIMAMTRNIAAAMNPAALAGFVRDMGSDYVKLLCVSALLGAFLTLMGALAERSWLLGLFVSILAVWTVLALFLATGATLRAHRDDFALLEALDDKDVRETRRKHADWQKVLDIAYASVRSGLAAQAYRTIKDLIAQEGNSLDVYQWTFNGMLEWDPPEYAAMLGERFAQRLWEEGRQVDALELVQRCRKLSPKFELPAAFRTQLAEYAREIGRHRFADDLSGS